jgi:hypothetical protein
MANIGCIAMMAIFWVSFQLVTYGLSAWVLHHSTGWRSDFWWMALVLAIPFGICEFVWIQAWRMGRQAELKVWSMLVISLACSVLGSTLSMLIYFRESPSWGSIIGLLLGISGSVVAIYYR